MRSPKECYKVRPGNDTLASFMNSSVVLTDCRVSVAVINTVENRRLLQERKVLRANETYVDLQRLLYRLLLNPTPELQAVIRAFKATHFTKPNVFAIQVRTGGYLADYPELMEMMSLAELERLPSVIVNAMASWNYNAGNTVLFLSTDSSYVEWYFQKELGSLYTVVTTSSFHRSHTKGIPNAAAVQRALLDLFLLADSDALLVCRRSGFGMVALSMGRAKRVIQYWVTHGKRSAASAEAMELYLKSKWCVCCGVEQWVEWGDCGSGDRRVVSAMKVIVSD